MGEYIAISQEAHRRWEKELNEYGILYIYAMTGYGKTVQATEFANEHYKDWKRFSASDEGFITSVNEYLKAHEKPKLRTLLILDDMQWLRDTQEQKKLFSMLLEQLLRNSRIKIIILSRSELPDYLSPLKVTKKLMVEDSSALILDREQLKELIIKEFVPEISESTELQHLITRTENTTKGYGLAVHAYLQRIKEYPNEDNTAETLAIKDIRNYLDTYLFSQWTVSRREAAVLFSVFPSFTKDMASELLEKNADGILADFMQVGSFLTFYAPDTYLFSPFFRSFLQVKLEERQDNERKHIYETAARCYERRRDYEQLLRCYKAAGRMDKVADWVIYLSENADGCSFAQISREYIDELPPEWEQREPGILGAKAMLAAYCMQPEKSRQYLERLHEAAQQEKKSVTEGNALRAYIRTVIANPCSTSDELKDNLLHFADYVKKYGIKVDYIMPTGNMPSLINGGLDLLAWEKKKNILYPVVKAAAELVMGREAIGIADAGMGEILYEQNRRSQAMGRLTKALSSANLRGCIRVQYAVTGIMARVFQSEEQLDTAVEILMNIQNKASESHFHELIPNIKASLVQCALLNNDSEVYNNWMNTEAINEHEQFYITERYQLFIKAKVYTAVGREMEALYIIGQLQEYADMYNRTYIDIELRILRAIILYRREEEWQEQLLGAVSIAAQYGLIRIFADKGAALLPLWKNVGWDGREEFKHKYITDITREMKRMAASYPDYLKPPKRYMILSDKENVVLKLMAQGYNNTQIAENLGINLGTAKFHVGNIMKKLDAGNRTVAVKNAQKEGLL